MNRLLEGRDQLLPIGSAQIGVEVDAAGFLLALQQVLQLVFGHAHDDVGVHLHESAVGIVGEALIAALGNNSLHGDVIETQVQDGVHHAGHGGTGAGANRDQKRVLGVAELLPHQVFDRGEVCLHLSQKPGRVVPAVFVVLGADFGGNGKTCRNRKPDAGHLGQVGPFSTQ